MIFICMVLSCSFGFSQNSKKILAIGDSNGAFEHGWVNQLQKLLPDYYIFNTSRSGNTIGFDNLGRSELNTLKNLDNYLKSATDTLGNIDYVVIMLGTNDAKYIFKDRQDEVVTNMQLLISRIHNYNFNFKTKPKIIILSPPPYGSDKILAKKYQGGEKRVQHLAKEYNKLAINNSCDYINIHNELKHSFDKHSHDGVHLDEEGQKAIATLIVTKLTKEQSKNKFISKPLDIYLLIGQSNMAGRAPIESQDLDSINNVFLFTCKDDTPWEKLANPVNKYSTIRKDIAVQKLSLGYEFAKELHKTYPDKKIGLVANARGGTSIEEWNPGEKLYNEALNQTKKALNYGVLKGIVWHQGESNASTYQSYMPKIIALIKAFRKDFNNKNLPFIVGQLSPDKPIRNDFNIMILKLSNSVKNTGVITTENTSTIDGAHFDSESQRILGKRYAKEMIKHVGN